MEIYLVSKTLHLIGIISWMAGILYLYRLFVYHMERGGQSEIHDLLSLMEMRLYRYITFPAMWVSVVAGAFMVMLNQSLLTQPWFHLKLTCGVLMVIFTFYGGYLHERLKSGKKEGFSGRKFRILNEVPTLLMIVIVCMVVFRPLFR
jgi:protoporphyrinogen IX oxidase